MTPSSAATTMTAMSVTLAPRARMAVNASWPGVSRKVISRPSWCDLVRADVLGDAAGLARRDLGGADGVQQRRLAVVDVAHDRDDRRAGDQVLLGVVEHLGTLGLLLGVDDVDLALQLGRDELDRVVREGLRDRGHLAQAHQRLDDLRRRDLEDLGEVLDRRARGHVDLRHVGRRHRGRGLLLRARAALAAAPVAALAGRAATTGLRVDDHAASLAAAAAATATAAATGRAAAGTAGAPPRRAAARPRAGGTAGGGGGRAGRPRSGVAGRSDACFAAAGRSCALRRPGAPLRGLALGRRRAVELRQALRRRGGGGARGLLRAGLLGLGGRRLGRGGGRRRLRLGGRRLRRRAASGVSAGAGASGLGRGGGLGASAAGASATGARLRGRGRRGLGGRRRGLRGRRRGRGLGRPARPSASARPWASRPSASRARRRAPASAPAWGSGSG